MLDPRPPSSRHPEHHRAPSAWGPLRGHHTLPGTHRGVCVGGLPALNPRPGAQGTPRGPLPSRGVTYSLTPPCSAAAKPRGLHGCHDNAGNSHRKPCREEEEKEEEENEGELPGGHPRSVPSSFGMMPQRLLWLFQHLRARGTCPGPALAPQEYPDPWEHKLWCSPPWQGVLEGAPAIKSQDFGVEGVGPRQDELGGVYPQCQGPCGSLGVWCPCPCPPHRHYPPLPPTIPSSTGIRWV